MVIPILAVFLGFQFVAPWFFRVCNRGYPTGYYYKGPPQYGSQQAPAAAPAPAPAAKAQTDAATPGPAAKGENAAQID